jgi:hypothetical protein
MDIRLVPPTVSLRETVVRGLRELQREGLPWHVGVDLDAVEQDFAAFVASFSPAASTLCAAD